MSPTLSPGAVDEEGRMPFYAEECASMLAVTFSGGDKMLRSIVSASWALHPLPLPHETSLRRHRHVSLGPRFPASPLHFLFPSTSGSQRVCRCWEIRAEDLK